MSYEIVLGRNKKDLERLGTKAAVFLGKHYVKMGAVTSYSNDIYLDVNTTHVVFVAGKRGSGKCLHGDTIVTLENGMQVPIRELESAKRNIIALNHELKLQHAEKTEFYKRKVNTLIKVTLRSGKSIKLTPEHPLLTVDGWIPAEKLSLGSRIATPRKIEYCPDEQITEAETKLIAYLLTEGHLANRFILFTNTDPEILKDYRNAVTNFDPTLQIKEHSAKETLRVVQHNKRTIHGERNNKGQFTQETKFDGQSSLRKWLEEKEMYGLKAHQKSIPECIFSIAKPKLSLFLNRLFSCDGSIYKKGEHWEISYASSSKQVANQVQHLLLRFGIISKKRRKQTSKRDSYEIIMRSEQAKTFIEAIGFFGKKEEKAITAINDLKNNKTKFNPNVDTVPREIWEQFEPESWAEIGRDLGYTVPKSMREATRYAPSRQKLLQIAKSAQNERLELFATSDIFWDEIKEMKVLEGSFTVYDITVPELHNFVANDIIVHNSYSMGVIAEGIADLPLDMRKRLAVVILDTMGIYWTMRYPNHQDESLLQEWNLRGKPLDITIFTPQGFYKDYKEKGIPTDFPFAIKPSELSAQDWFITFELNENNPVAIIIERVILQLQEELHTGKREDYTIADIINTIQNMEDEVESSRKAAVNRFKSAAQWGIFDNAGTPLWEIVKPGRVSVLDVSAYATAANGWKIKNLVVGLVSQKLFLQRMVSRKEEEAKAIQSSVHYISSGAQEIQDEPMVWLIIDEAHEFLPNQGKTAATDALVTLLREGRQPGISMILATQQPGKIHTDVMTQSDIFLSHHITARLDTDALGALMQSYLRKGLDVELNNLPKIKGAALVLDDVNERLFPMKIRPRITWHGGSAPEVLRKEKNIFEF